MNSLIFKTLLKLLLNSGETENFFLLKTLAKIPKEWGLHRPKQKLAVGLNSQPDTAGGRPAGRSPTVENPTVGAPGRPPRYREQGSLVRSTDRSTVPVSAKRAQGCARRSTRNGRPALGSADRAADRPGLSATVWVRSWVK